MTQETKLEQSAYHRRDPRVKCGGCGRWMRRAPTAKTPATRRPAPGAAWCTDCPLPPRVAARLEVWSDGVVLVPPEAG